MLTELERDRILHREELTVPEKKNLNFRLRKKLIGLKQTLEDIRLILTYLPQDELREELDFGHLRKSLDVTDSLIEIIDPWPVGEHEDEEPRAFRVHGMAIPDSKPGKCTIKSISRTASLDEINLHKHLKDHLDKLLLCVDPCTPDPVCRDVEFYQLQMNEMLNLQKVSRGVIQASFDGYTDEIGLDNDGWVVREPTSIDIDRLPQIRWKPRGLKECMKLPEILAPKEITRGPEIFHVSVHMDKDGTHHSLSENGEKERPITEEEFLEYDKKHEVFKKGVPASPEEREEQSK